MPQTHFKRLMDWIFVNTEILLNHSAYIYIDWRHLAEVFLLPVSGTVKPVSLIRMIRDDVYDV